MAEIAQQVATGNGITSRMAKFFDSKVQRFFSERLHGKPLNSAEIEKVCKDLQFEAKDNSNFREQTRRIHATKAHCEREIIVAMQTAGKLEKLVFPKEHKVADEEWTSLAKQLKIIEENSFKLSFSVKALLTVYIHEFRTLEVEIKEAQRVGEEVGASEEEIAFIRAILLPTLREIYAEIQKCLQLSESCTEVAKTHVAEQAAQKHILQGSILENFGVEFDILQAQGRTTTKFIHTTLRKHAKQIRTFETGAALVAKAAKENREQAMIKLGDKMLGYFTIGNVLSAIGYTGLALSGVGIFALGSRIFKGLVKRVFETKTVANMSSFFAAAAEEKITQIKHAKDLQKVMNTY